LIAGNLPDPASYQQTLFRTLTAVCPLSERDRTEVKKLFNKKSHRTDVGWLKSLTKGMMKWSKIRLPDAADSSGR
jgi:hypothetical protein